MQNMQNSKCKIEWVQAATGALRQADSPITIGLRTLLLAGLVLGVCARCFGGESSASELLAGAQEAAQRGKSDEALAQATKALTADPKNAAAYALRGRLYSAAREPEKAAADFGKLIELQPEQAQAYQWRGCEHFRLGRMSESIADFDAFLKRTPGQEPHHWQRGISYYYAGRFEDGRKQFELHQTVNPNDVENAVWHFLCAARESGLEKARAALLPIRHDARVPMMQVYALFKGEAKPEDVLAAAKAGSPPARLKQQLFYADLYLGLYHEATGDSKLAREHILRAAEQAGAMDYMGDVARVHARRLQEAAPKKE